MPFILHTDASDFAIGGILGQKDEQGREHIVKYLHRTFNPAERNYGATEREACAAIWCIEKCHEYLIRQEFELITDHQALK